MINLILWPRNPSKYEGKLLLSRASNFFNLLALQASNFPRGVSNTAIVIYAISFDMDEIINSEIKIVLALRSLWFTLQRTLCITLVSPQFAFYGNSRFGIFESCIV